MKCKTNGVEFVELRLNAAKASDGWRAPRPTAFVSAVYPRLPRRPPPAIPDNKGFVTTSDSYLEVRLLS